MCTVSARAAKPASPKPSTSCAASSMSAWRSRDAGPLATSDRTYWRPEKNMRDCEPRSGAGLFTRPVCGRFPGLAILRLLERHGHLSVGREFVNNPLADGLAVMAFGPFFGAHGAVDFHFRGKGLVRRIAVFEDFVMPECMIVAVEGVDHQRVDVLLTPGVGEAAHHERPIGRPATIRVPDKGFQTGSRVTKLLTVIDPTALGDRKLFRPGVACSERGRSDAGCEREQEARHKITAFHPGIPVGGCPAFLYHRRV